MLCSVVGGYRYGVLLLRHVIETSFSEYSFEAKGHNYMHNSVGDASRMSPLVRGLSIEISSDLHLVSQRKTESTMIRVQLSRSADRRK